MHQYLLLLLSFFFPFVEPGEHEVADDTSDAGTDDAEDTALAAAGDDADDESDDADSEDDDTADVSAPASRSPRTVSRSDRADEAIRLAREAQEAVARLTPAPRNAQYDDEEVKLRNPDTTELEKWQIQSNRAMRESTMQSRQALFQAQDMADRTQYQAKAMGNSLYSKFEKKVEAELANARNKGGNPPREMVLDLVVGRAIREGNFKPKAEAKKAAIPRGKSPGARSDTQSRGSMTDHQKRTVRLANTQI